MKLLRIYSELAKARLSSLVVMTAAVGFIVPEERVRWGLFIATVLGTALVAGGAGAFNMVMERDRDARMHRTRKRPIPAGEIGVLHASLFAFATALAGLAILFFAVGPKPAELALYCLLLYALIYTPLKAHSSLNTIVGAVVGAIPPVIGWVASTGRIDFGAIILAAVLFVWQIPHFLSLDWMYREDYARGGYVMLSAADPSGRSTVRMALLYSLALIPIGIVAVAAGMAGLFFGIGAFLLGLMMTHLGLKFLRSKGQKEARGLFFASLLYLPLLLGLMVADRGPIPIVEARGSVASEAHAPESTVDHDDPRPND
ncbi:MAG: protoheme IX farnesyltransferase [Gemmatimonadetes bacterium]|nr:protoheme IX farnesyltransferase [Gemmatimonadota bacterium]